MRPVYLDHNATTPLHPNVKSALLEALEEFGNPSSGHALGRRAAGLCAEARDRVARLVGSDADEIYFTGSGTEAVNLALQGLAGVRRIVASAVEHPCVLETLSALQERGVQVELTPVDREGVLDLDALRSALSRPTDLVCVMFANNEVGTIQPIEEIARLAHGAGALLHVDAVQAVGKLPVHVGQLGIDLLAASAHKMNGPKGVGFLYARRGVRLRRLIHGGGQERGLRAGTENTLGLIALGAAALACLDRPPSEQERIRSLRDRLWAGLSERIPGLRRFGHPGHGLPGTLAIGLPELHAEPVFLMLDQEEIRVSMGAACHTDSPEPSHVLAAMGVPASVARGFLRLSLGLDSQLADVERVVAVLPGIVDRLLSLRP